MILVSYAEEAAAGLCCARCYLSIGELSWLQSTRSFDSFFILFQLVIAQSRVLKTKKIQKHMDDPKDAEVSTDKGEQVVVPIDVVTDEYS